MLRLFYKKGSDYLLQYPINVRPENIAIPTTEDVDHSTMASFTFQGDYLSGVAYRIIDCATNEIEYDSAGVGAISGTPIAYNGDTYELGYLSSKNFLTSGHNYVIQMMLMQKTQDGQGNLYDMPCIGGTITSVNANTRFVLEKNLPIYEWSSTHEPTRDSQNIVAAGMAIKIKDEMRFITAYNVSTGEITVQSAFTFTVTAGMRYKIYSNYLITPQYYFECRSLPTITASIETVDSGGVGVRGQNIHVSATYVQQENVMIKYYIARLYASYHELTNQYLLAETPKIYSQNIDYTFLEATLGVTPWGDSIYGNQPFDVDYRVEFEVVSQDNETFKANATMRIQSSDDEITPLFSDIRFTPNRDKGCVDIQYITQSGADRLGFIITRIDLLTGEKKEVKYLRHDYGVAANARYQYHLIYFDPDTGQPYITLDEQGKNIYSKTWEVDTSSLDGYTITALTPVKPSGEFIENWYEPQESWHFICDIENPTMTHNYDKHLQVGYGRYSAMTSTPVNYLTGTLTAMLGKLNCATKEFEDTIAMVKAWRDFISQPCPFLLKSPKGDIWIVNVTDASTTYDEQTPQKYTTFSFSWAECDSIDNATLYAGNG